MAPRQINTIAALTLETGTGGARERGHVQRHRSATSQGLSPHNSQWNGIPVESGN